MRPWVGGLGQSQVEARLRELEKLRAERASVEAEIQRMKGGAAPAATVPVQPPAGATPPAAVAVPSLSIGAVPSGWGRLAVMVGGTALAIFVVAKLVKSRKE